MPYGGSCNISEYFKGACVWFMVFVVIDGVQATGTPSIEDRSTVEVITAPLGGSEYVPSSTPYCYRPPGQQHCDALLDIGIFFDAGFASLVD